MGKVKGSDAQHARFVEAAREVGADVDSSAADTLMGRLAKTPPEPKPGTKPPKQAKDSTDLEDQSLD